MYKRSYDSILLICVDRREVEKIIIDVHEGSFGTHCRGNSMAKKILKAGYYWLNMEIYCFCHVHTCHKCQIYVDRIHVPLVPLNVISSLWPFVMWGIDVISHIEPTTLNEHRFILVAVDYFTKWVEVGSYTNVTKQVMAHFLKRDIIYHYGIPNKIIIENGLNLNNKMMKELRKSFKIEHHNSSPHRPKMNGVVEAANKT